MATHRADPRLPNTGRPPQLLQVARNVHAACDFGRGNAAFVVTGDSVVVIDTTESVPAARRVLAELRKVSSLPVSHIIYTHSHPDQIRGARVFHTPTTKVVAQRGLLQELAGGQRVNGQQMPAGNSAETRQDRGGFVSPDFLVDENDQFIAGEMEFQLGHVPGETADHLMVWLPGSKVLFCGDLFMNGFPVLSHPTLPDRPVLDWADSLDRMRTLKPDHLVPAHARPLSGAGRIDAVLGHYAEAIRLVFDQTLAGINEGLHLEQVRARVRLPDQLAQLPYLQERRGKVAWAVNGIFRQYAGWYAADPKTLDPCPRAVFGSALIEICGGSHSLVERARQALENGDGPLALELADVVLAVARDRTALAIRNQALARLAQGATNRIAQDLYQRALASADRPAPAPNRERTADVLNDYYDGRMFSTCETQAGEDDYHNWGYWEAGTSQLAEASEALMEKLLAFLPRKDGAILDVACGKGATTRHLLRYYSADRVTGINISEKQLERGRSIVPGCRFLKMDATQMTFGDDSFDNIICVQAAFNFNTRADFLREAFRVLKPGGRLVLSDMLVTRQREAASPLRNVKNYLSGIDDYRRLLEQERFVARDIVDATTPCWIGFHDHSARGFRSDLDAGTLDQATYQSEMDKLAALHRTVTFYLLVAAEKPGIG